MSAPKFDITKPHGTVTGDETVNPRRYEQNGHHYCNDGSLWVPPTEVKAVEAVSDVEQRIADAVAKATADTDKKIAAAVALALKGAK